MDMGLGRRRITRRWERVKQERSRKIGD